MIHHLKQFHATFCFGLFQALRELFSGNKAVRTFNFISKVKRMSFYESETQKKNIKTFTAFLTFLLLKKLSTSQWASHKPPSTPPKVDASCYKRAALIGHIPTHWPWIYSCLITGENLWGSLRKLANKLCILWWSKPCGKRLNKINTFCISRVFKGSDENTGSYPGPINWLKWERLPLSL